MSVMWTPECGVHSSKTFITASEQVCAQNSLCKNLLINVSSKQQHQSDFGFSKVSKWETAQQAKMLSCQAFY